MSEKFSPEEGKDFKKPETLKTEEWVYQYLERFFNSDDIDSGPMYDVYKETGVVLNKDDFEKKVYSQDEIKKIEDVLKNEEWTDVFLEYGERKEGEDEKMNATKKNKFSPDSFESEKTKQVVKMDIKKFSESKESIEARKKERDDFLAQIQIIEIKVKSLVEKLPDKNDPTYDDKASEILTKLDDIGFCDFSWEDLPDLFADFADLISDYSSEESNELRKIKRTEFNKKLEIKREVSRLNGQAELMKRLGRVLSGEEVGGVEESEEENHSSEDNIERALETYKEELNEIFSLDDYSNELSENNGKELRDITIKLDDKRRKGEIFTTEEIEEYKKLIRFIDGKMKGWKNASESNQVKNIEFGSELHTLKEQVDKVEIRLNAEKEIIKNALANLEIKDSAFRSFSRKSLKEMLEEFQNGHINFNKSGNGEKYLSVYLKKLDNELKKIPKNEISRNPGESQEEFNERERLNEIEYKKKQLELKILTQGFFSLIDSGLVSNNCIYANNLMVRKEKYIEVSKESPQSGEIPNQQKSTMFNYAVLDGKRLLDIDETFDIDNFKIDDVYKNYSVMEGIFRSNNENGFEGENKNLLAIDGQEFCTMDVYRRFYQKEVNGNLVDKEINEFGFIDASEMPIVQRIVYAIFQEMTKEKDSSANAGSVDSIKSKFSAHIDFNSVGGIMEAICESDYMVDRFGRTIKLNINKELESFGPEKELIKYIAKIKAARDNLKSEANFKLMGRVGTSLQFNATLRGEDGRASHLGEILSQKGDDKGEHGQYFLMNRFLDTSEFAEKNIYKRIPEKINPDGTYRKLTKEDFSMTADEKRDLKEAKEKFNNFSKLRMEVLQIRESGGQINDRVRAELRNIGINNFEINFVLSQLDLLISGLIKLIGDSQKCNPGLLAVENLSEADKYIHDRYQSLGIQKYKFKRGESYVNWVNFVNEMEGVKDGDSYSSSEGAYKKVMYGAAEMVKKAPQSRDMDEWLRFIGDVEGDSKDEDTIYSILAEAGAIKSYLAQTAVTGNPDVKYQHVWEQMRSAITYMIVGSLEKIPGVVQSASQGNFIKNALTGNKKNRDEYREYRKFVIEIADAIIKRSESKGEKKFIPPFLVDEANAILEEIKNEGPALDKILNKYSSKTKTGNYFYKLNEYRFHRDPNFMIRYERARMVERGEMWTSIPDEKDFLNYGNTL